jgi:hypothetical protein
MTLLQKSLTHIPGNLVTPNESPLPLTTSPFHGTEKHGKLEASSQHTLPLVATPQKKHANENFAHPFIGTLNTAYDLHYPVTLSPDMIWLLIAQGVAIHINENVEALRHHFVAFQDKVTIIVRRDGFRLGSPHNDWSGVFNEFSHSIRTHIGEDNHARLVPTFSTTDCTSKVAFEITLMDTMQSYFDYMLATLCGIPYFLLEGTVEDWEKLRAYAEDLVLYDLDWWLVHLLPLLNEFVLATKGQANPDFWKNFYKYDGNSGGPYITGSVLNFFPYGVYSFDTEMITRAQARGQSLPKQHRNSFLGQTNIQQMGGLKSDVLPSGLSSAPLTWQYLDRELPMQLISGFVGMSQDKDTCALRPEIGWAVYHTK